MRNKMKLDIIIPLAYLSYYRYSFFVADLVIFLVIFYLFYHITDNPMKKYSPMRDVILRMLSMQAILCVVMLFIIFSRKPILVHTKTDIRTIGFLFVLTTILRIANIMMITGFLITYWNPLKEDKKKWLILLCALLLYYAYNLFYLLFPTINRALIIYEMFYNIRNLFITNDPDKKQKTMSYLRQMRCIPKSIYPLFRDEWARTFKNKPAPLQCPS